MHFAVDRRHPAADMFFVHLLRPDLLSENSDPSGLLLAFQVFPAARLTIRGNRRIQRIQLGSEQFVLRFQCLRFRPHTLLIAGQNHLLLLHFPDLALQFLRFCQKQVGVQAAQLFPQTQILLRLLRLPFQRSYLFFQLGQNIRHADQVLFFIFQLLLCDRLAPLEFHDSSRLVKQLAPFLRSPA